MESNKREEQQKYWATEVYLGVGVTNCNLNNKTLSHYIATKNPYDNS